jgi:hypothetical protein
MVDTNQLRERFNPIHPGDGRDDRSLGAFAFQMLIHLFSLFGFVFCLTCLYLAMRGIMRLGGMVASGGPYAIEHPAPGWAWIFPVSMLTGAVFIGLNAFTSRRVGGLSVLALSWPAAFLALGWNFLDFAFNATRGHGLVWGWLVCGIVFVLMGGLPLIYVAQGAIKALRGQDRTSFFVGVGEAGAKRAKARFGRPYQAIILLVQLAVMAGGIVAADRLFHSLSVAKPKPVADKTAADKPAGPPPAVPAPPAAAMSNQPPQPQVVYSPRIIISFDHNTLEIVPNERRVFYRGSVYIDPKDLPLEARQVLEQTTQWLTEFLKY